MRGSAGEPAEWEIGTLRNKALTDTAAKETSSGF